ncbi:hypothetical protein ILUMI_16316, partial [Ignelater luminosus]
ALAEPLQRSLFKDAEKSGARIVGGAPALRYEFPHQIAIHMNNQHICGGSILTAQWVVTAGHCIVGSANQMVVYAGMLNQRENHPDVQALRVSRIVVHPAYPGGVAPNDIALMQLASSLRWTQAVQPISLPREHEEFTGLAWVSGWGYLSSANPVTPTALQKLNMRIWTYSQCANNLNALIGTSYPLDDTMICLGGPITGRETVCQGDSGGPVVQNGKLLGVASWTLTPCGTYAAPSVYTKVSKFVTFIRQYVPGV